MAKQFFTEWDLWQKLVFILGLAIVVTVMLGLIKLCSIHRKLQKHTALAAKEKQAQSKQQRLSEKQIASSSRSDVPFGVRALESGIEVEGVWHSRSNTPEPGSRRSSFQHQHPTQERPPRLDGLVDLEKQSQPASSVPAKSIQHGKSNSVVRPDLSISTRDDTIGHPRLPKPIAVIEKPSRGQHPPPSLSRFEGNPYVTRPVSAASALEGLEAIHRASTELNGDSSSSGHSVNDIESIVASAPNLFGPQSATSDRKQSKEFDLLDSHRSSLAAETGHLTPRLRKFDSNGNSLPTSATAGPEERVDYFSSHIPAQPPSSSGSEASQTSDPFATPKYAALPAIVRQASPPVGIPSFMQFCQMNPPSPRPLSPASGHSPVRSPDAAVTSPLAAQVPLIAKSVVPAQKENQQKRVSFEKYQPEPKVLRGHGSGFEILQQGTFAVQPEPKAMGGPPISLYNKTFRTRSTGTDGRMKLRKTRRMSQGSDVSAGSSGATSEDEKMD